MNLASYIEHTVLKPDCSPQDIEQACKEAILRGYAAVCVPPFYVKQAVGLLEGEKVKVATVIGFPLGYTTTPAKVEEIKKAIEDGADEVDAVANVCAVKSGNWNFVANDIDSMATAAHLKGKAIKVILETELLTEAEITKLCKAAIEAQADFVKASTGFNGQGASLEVVRLLKKVAGNKLKVKAAGNIQNRLDAERFIDAGAQRIEHLLGQPAIG